MEPALTLPRLPSVQSIAVLTRIRRMGWVLAGSWSLADQILLDELSRAGQGITDGPFGDPHENIFAWAFRVFDGACSETGVIRSVPQWQKTPDRLGHRLHTLPYELRPATLVLVIEEFPPEKAAEITGRSVAALLSAALAATELLDQGDGDGDGDGEGDRGA